MKKRNQAESRESVTAIIRIYSRSIGKIRARDIARWRGVGGAPPVKFNDKNVRVYAYLQRTLCYHLFWEHSMKMTFYRAMHFSAYARSWDRMSSVRPSVCNVGGL